MNALLPVPSPDSDLFETYVQSAITAKRKQMKQTPDENDEPKTLVYGVTAVLVVAMVSPFVSSPDSFPFFSISISFFSSCVLSISASFFTGRTAFFSFPNCFAPGHRQHDAHHTNRAHSQNHRVVVGSLLPVTYTAERISGDRIREVCPEKLFQESTFPCTSGSLVVLMMEEEVGADAT